MRYCSMRTAAAALALCAGLFAAGPASAGLFDDEIARKQIAEQQKRVDELRQQNDGMAGRLAKLEEDAKAQPVLALVAEIEKLREEIRNLRGQVETLGNNIEGVAKRQRDMYVDLDQRLRRFEQPGAAAAPAAGRPGPRTQAVRRGPCPPTRTWLRGLRRGCAWRLPTWSALPWCVRRVAAPCVARMRAR